MTAHSKHLSADERRAVTVATVVGLAAEQNPSSITTASIAQRMGVTQGALFRHFANKDAILQAVISWISHSLFARIQEVAAGQDSTLAILRAIFAAHVDFVTRHPGVPRLVFGELQSADDSPQKLAVKAMTTAYGKALREYLQAGKANGELAADLDVDAAAVQFLGMIQGLVIQSLIANDSLHVQRHADGVFALYARGIQGQV
ncbi:TetR/AcrR family transcriptional regulator [Castellaniella sp.]|uniref:TetR/AcrR family transcriptional regulator n=1 Tax=Castellaniella sp. TaxID=1955812 RepID=UPI002AFDDF3A|nr:TetR family transcriptional regulator [Castellaniella sp.]